MSLEYLREYSRESIIDWEDGLTCTYWMPIPLPPEDKSKEQG